jgi:hypothetical protein
MHQPIYFRPPRFKCCQKNDEHISDDYCYVHGSVSTGTNMGTRRMVLSNNEGLDIPLSYSGAAVFMVPAHDSDDTLKVNSYIPHLIGFKKNYTTILISNILVFSILITITFHTLELPCFSGYSRYIYLILWRCNCTC